MTTTHPEPNVAAGAEVAAVGTYDVDEGDLLLRVSGILPAADFHPFVVREARKLGLRGWIRHESGGAVIRAVGFENELVQLVRAIRDEAPSSARVRGMDPDVITAATPAIADPFIPLVEDTVEWHPDPKQTLAHVA